MLFLQKKGQLFQFHRSSLPFSPCLPVRVLCDLALALVGHARAEELVGVRRVERGGLAAAGGLQGGEENNTIWHTWQSRILYVRNSTKAQVNKSRCIVVASFIPYMSIVSFTSLVLQTFLFYYFSYTAIEYGRLLIRDSAHSQVRNKPHLGLFHDLPPRLLHFRRRRRQRGEAGEEGGGERALGGGLTHAVNRHTKMLCF